MALLIRMALYFVSAFLAGQGVGIYDAEAGTLTLHLESLALALAGVVSFVGTYIVSRIAKARGGVT